MPTLQPHDCAAGDGVLGVLGSGGGDVAQAQGVGATSMAELCARKFDPVNNDVNFCNDPQEPSLLNNVPIAPLNTSLDPSDRV